MWDPETEGDAFGFGEEKIFIASARRHLSTLQQKLQWDILFQTTSPAIS